MVTTALFTNRSGRLRVTSDGPNHSPRVELDDQARETSASEALSQSDCAELARVFLALALPTETP